MGNNCCLYASSEDLNAKPVKENSIEDRKLNEPTELPHISDREGNMNLKSTLSLLGHRVFSLNVFHCQPLEHAECGLKALPR